MTDCKRIFIGWTFVLLAFGVLCFSGCGKDTSDDVDKELVIMCGSSFVNPARQLAEEFKASGGSDSAMTIAGSEDFLPLVKAGKQGDILITHDPYLDYVGQANALASSTHVGFVAPVLAVQKGNPKNITSIEDLASDGLKVALSDPKYSTCGEMVKSLLEKKGILEDVMKNVGNRLTKGHNNLGNFLKLGEVDAVVMWNGVANVFSDSLEVVETPYEYDSEIRVHVIGLNYSAQPEAVESFIEFAAQNAEDIFAGHGYIK